MILGLRQALTRIDCLPAFESGPRAEEPCPAEMADYDQLEIKYMKEMNVYTLCEHGAVK